jgi:HTH-type transcriptional repressor of NAD biosynthesis genes
MTRALVFGKFLPFHRGHEVLISAALEHANQVLVVVCASDRESISEARRVGWLREYYQGVPAAEIVGLSYREEDLPNTSVSDREVSRVWSEYFRTLLKPVDLVVTGESYGDYVAEYMGIRHVRVFRDGVLSASSIRHDPMGMWQHINPVCRRDLVKSVVIVGTESSGKSTLVRRLGEYFGTAYVEEAARDVVSHTESCTFEDLSTVAHEHARRIDLARGRARRLLFIDTDIYTTISYARFLFSRDLLFPQELFAASQAELRLYLDAATAEYVQDGTRLDKARRDLLDSSHRRVLDEAGQSYTILTGSYEERLESAKRLIAGLIPI